MRTLQLQETATRLKMTGKYETVLAVSDHFKFKADGYWRAPSYQLWQRTKTTDDPRGWDGFTRPVKKVEGLDRWYYLDRGHKDQFVAFCRDQDIELTGPLLTSPFANITVDDVPDVLLPGATFELDLSQRECVCNLLKHGIGSIKATVSAGKTAIFYGAAAMVKLQFPQARVLYVTPTERLVKQVTSEGRKFLPEWSISQYGGGKDDSDGEDVVVATSAKLSVNHDELVYSKWYKRFTVLIYDEVQHIASPSSVKVTTCVPAFFRFGGSDSVKDSRKEDVAKGTMIRGMIGPVRAEITVAPLITIGRVAKPWIYMVDIAAWQGKYDHINHRAEPDSPAWIHIEDQWQKATYLGPAYELDEHGNPVLDKRNEPVAVLSTHRFKLGEAEVEVNSQNCLLHRVYDQAIIRFKDRNNLVVAWARHFTAKGWPTLVVATRTIHVRILVTLLCQAGIDARALTSEHTTKERDEVFDWLVNSKGGLLVSPLVKEGVSLPELKAGIVADPVADPDLARQIIGRFIRKKPDGDNHAHIVWFIDRQYPSGRRNSVKLFGELDKIRGYNFHHPCAGPDQVGKLHEAANFD